MECFVTKADGKTIIYKDPNARKPYGINLAAVIEREGSPLAAYSVAASVGVRVTTFDGSGAGQPFAQGATPEDTVLTVVGAWVDQGDASLPQNSITFRYQLANGYQDDKTLHFAIREK